MFGAGKATFSCYQYTLMTNSSLATISRNLWTSSNNSTNNSSARMRDQWATSLGSTSTEIDATRGYTSHKNITSKHCWRNSTCQTATQPIHPCQAGSGQ